MKSIRIIPRLDLKPPNLIKGVQFEGYRNLGDPVAFATKYYLEGADELIFVDNVASLYGQTWMHDFLLKLTELVFIPITVVGGIRSVDSAVALLRNGADKVGVNTGAIDNPGLLQELVKEIGSQSVVLSVEAKSSRSSSGQVSWECLTNFGRDRSGLEVKEWIGVAQDIGVGEVFVTSVDRDGTKGGAELNLLRHLGDGLAVPLIFSGGVGTLRHVSELLATNYVDAIALGASLHYENLQIKDVKAFVQEAEG